MLERALPTHLAAAVLGIVFWMVCGASAPAAIVTGAHYEFDANVLGPGERWSNTGNVTYEDFPMTGLLPVPVSDPNFPGIVAAYQTGRISTASASGVHGAYEFAGTGNPRIGDATFELWVNLADLQTPQILGEVGGGFSGVLFAVSAGWLEYFINADTPDGGESESLIAPISTGWNQIVGTYTRSDGHMELFINGRQVEESGPTGIDHWAGSNAAGLGNFGSSTHATGSATFGDNDRVDAPLRGQLSVYRFYSRVLDQEEIETNYFHYALIPEPQTGVLAVLAACVVLTRRRRSAGR